MKKQEAEQLSKKENEEKLIDRILSKIENQKNNEWKLSNNDREWW